MTARLELPASQNAAVEASGDAAELETIVESLHRHTGLDVREYRRPTIERRIRNRMISVGEPTFASYARRIAHSPDEACALLERISIKVSQFYRNADVFGMLHKEVLPALADSVRDRPLQIWSAGCGRGEEPWTLAMLLHDLGIDAVVHATDIDSAALAVAHRARYHEEAIGALPSALADRYLTRTARPSEWQVASALRHLVRFSVHDLLSDSAVRGNRQFDLICCRNVLIYFQRTAQERTFSRLEQSLSLGGVLCVGEAEWPCGPAAHSLVPAAPRVRIFLRSRMEQAA